MPSTPLSLWTPGFSGMELPEGGLDACRALVLPIPYDATCSYRKGCAEGPKAIVDASWEVEMFDEELDLDTSQVGIATLVPLEVHAGDPAEMVGRVRLAAREAAHTGKFLVSLGGEHSITDGLVGGLQDAGVKDFAVLQIDAHADLRDEYQGTKASHAAVMRRVLEKTQAIQVGIRSWSAGEAALVRSRQDSIFTMQRIRRTPDWIDQVLAALPPRVYLTIDLDGLDPAVCPGVGTPEPGGLSWVDLLGLLRRLFLERQVVAADVVELMPIPGQHVSQALAARLVLKILAYRFEKELRNLSAQG